MVMVKKGLIARIFEELIGLLRFFRLTYEEALCSYQENLPTGPKNLSIKKDRIKNGGDFESSGMIFLNKVVASLVQGEKMIVNVGSGTGIFEMYVPLVAGRKVISSEFDEECVDWCKKNRPKDNIVYCSLSIEELLIEYGKFDLAVCVDVIEHVRDYSAFLREFVKLSERAIISTPNKARNFSALTSTPPKYLYHVREWTAGEFFWILRNYYRKVDLYGVYGDGSFKKVGLLSTAPKIVARCEV